MEEFTGLYDVRDFKIEDINFILASLKKGVYYGDARYRDLPKAEFMEAYSKIADRMLKENVVKVACLKDDTDVILGYSILSPDFQGIKWVYVKERWRGKGIGKSLVPLYATYCTHMTAPWEKIIKKFDNMIFNPLKN